MHERVFNPRPSRPYLALGVRHVRDVEVSLCRQQAIARRGGVSIEGVSPVALRRYSNNKEHEKCLHETIPQQTRAAMTVGAVTGVTQVDCPPRGLTRDARIKGNAGCRKSFLNLQRPIREMFSQRAALSVLSF